MRLTILVLIITTIINCPLTAQAGELDKTFSNDGKAETSIVKDNADVIYSMAIYPDGKIVAAGASKNNNTNYWMFSLARYNPTGSLDTSFNGVGTQPRACFFTLNEKQNGLNY